MENDDCIYYEQHEKSTGMRCCTSRGTLYKEDEDMCSLCRLWDNYIPKDASEGEKEKALEWQNLEYKELVKTDYDTFFKGYKR